jgi:hypothetical protein
MVTLHYGSYLYVFPYTTENWTWEMKRISLCVDPSHRDYKEIQIENGLPTGSTLLYPIDTFAFLNLEMWQQFKEAVNFLIQQRSLLGVALGERCVKAE